MPVVNAVITHAGRERITRYLAGQISYPGNLNPIGLAYFKIGEGGYDPATPNQPKIPNPAYTDLEAKGCDVNNKQIFQKNLMPENIIVEPYPSDIGYVNSIVVTITLESEEANEGCGGGIPRYGEIGLFDYQDTLIVYGTYTSFLKYLGRSATFTIRIVI